MTFLTRLAPILMLVVAACTGPEQSGTSTTIPTSTPVPHQTPSTLVPGETRVGVVGCSVTLDAVRGYGRIGGSRIWPESEFNYGLGTVAAWAETDTRYWEQFEAGLEEYPDTKDVWWQLCAGSGDDSLDEAIQALSMLRSLAPGVSIYVSAQPSYSPGHVCPIAGPMGPDDMASLVEALVAEHGALPGPDMGVLPDERLRDNCHSDQEGAEEQGRILLGFFGG
ncbi:MAG TPA: hypothetical protein VMS99_14265 [Acidimicrobiia bacterium]|nr:hypothetical protein [Acidimicrobiia bacterium]